jgi:hypothetical protein
MGKNEKQMEMYMYRSGSYEEEGALTELFLTEKEEHKYASVDIDKNKLIDILKEISTLKESKNAKNMFDGATDQENKIEIENILLKLALMNLGFVPGKDDSVEKFHQKLSLYLSDKDVQQYLSFDN